MINVPFLHTFLISTATIKIFKIWISILTGRTLVPLLFSRRTPARGKCPPNRFLMALPYTDYGVSVENSWLGETRGEPTGSDRAWACWTVREIKKRFVGERNLCGRRPSPGADAGYSPLFPRAAVRVRLFVSRRANTAKRYATAEF